MAGLYVIGRHLFDRGTGLVAALLYSVYQPWGTFKKLAFNGELIMNLPLGCACAIVFARTSARLRPELLAAGALLGAAFLLPISCSKPSQAILPSISKEGAIISS